jgi:hypothetical protein
VPYLGLVLAFRDVRRLIIMNYSTIATCHLSKWKRRDHFVATVKNEISRLSAERRVGRYEISREPEVVWGIANYAFDGIVRKCLQYFAAVALMQHNAAVEKGLLRRGHQFMPE